MWYITGVHLRTVTKVYSISLSNYVQREGELPISVGQGPAGPFCIESGKEYKKPGMQYSSPQFYKVVIQRMFYDLLWKYFAIICLEASGRVANKKKTKKKA